MAISFNAIGQQQVSFLADDTAAAGKLCKLTGNGTVGACAAGDGFCGLVTSVRSGIACVSVAGYVELPYSGTAPEVGHCALVSDGAGGVKTATPDGDETDAAGGRSLLVVSVDSSSNVIGVFL